MQKKLSILALIIAGFVSAGCTLMVGNNDVGQVAPRGSYRSVDTSGQESEGLQEMQGGGDVKATVPVQ